MNFHTKIMQNKANVKSDGTVTVHSDWRFKVVIYSIDITVIYSVIKCEQSCFIDH